MNAEHLRAKIEALYKRFEDGAIALSKAMEETGDCENKIDKYNCKSCSLACKKVKKFCIYHVGFEKICDEIETLEAKHESHRKLQRRRSTKGLEN